MRFAINLIKQIVDETHRLAGIEERTASDSGRHLDHAFAPLG